MNISIDRKKKEAIKRMKAMGIYSDIIDIFEKNNIVSRSEAPFGAFYFISEQEKEFIKHLEETHNLLVYMTVRSYTTIGIMDSIFFVGDYEEEWEYDIEDLKDNIAFVYVRNYNDQECSEFGSIGWSLTAGKGIIRIF